MILTYNTLSLISSACRLRIHQNSTERQIFHTHEYSGRYLSSLVRAICRTASRWWTLVSQGTSAYVRIATSEYRLTGIQQPSPNSLSDGVISSWWRFIQQLFWRTESSCFSIPKALHSRLELQLRTKQLTVSYPARARRVARAEEWKEYQVVECPESQGE